MVVEVVALLLEMLLLGDGDVGAVATEGQSQYKLHSYHPQSQLVNSLFHNNSSNNNS